MCLQDTLSQKTLYTYWCAVDVGHGLETNLQNEFTFHHCPQQS